MSASDPHRPSLTPSHKSDAILEDELSKSRDLSPTSQVNSDPVSMQTTEGYGSKLMLESTQEEQGTNAVDDGTNGKSDE